MFGGMAMIENDFFALMGEFSTQELGDSPQCKASLGSLACIGSGLSPSDTWVEGLREKSGFG